MTPSLLTMIYIKFCPLFYNVLSSKLDKFKTRASLTCIACLLVFKMCCGLRYISTNYRVRRRISKLLKSFEQSKEKQNIRNCLKKYKSIKINVEA